MPDDLDERRREIVGQVDDWLRGLATTVVEAQRRLDRDYDDRIRRIPPEIARDPLLAELLPSHFRLAESTLEAEVEIGTSRRVGGSLSLRLDAKPIYRFYEAQFRTESTLRSRLRVQVSAVAPPDQPPFPGPAAGSTENANEES